MWLLLSPPLGDINLKQQTYGHIGPVPGGTLERVLERGKLRCAVRGGRPGFASFQSNTSSWVGMDVCFCTALGASLFDGECNAVEFIDVQEHEAENGFALLRDDRVDVFAGALWSLQNSVRENVSQQGYSFSQPYFYGPVNGTWRDDRFEENLCLLSALG